MLKPPSSAARTPPRAQMHRSSLPARNEERNIRNCLESILAQDYPNFEIIVLEDRFSCSY